MTYCLFLDDERNLEDVPWRHSSRGEGDHQVHPILIARSSAEAQARVLSDGLPAMISFDHDLGGDDTGFKFMWWLINGHLDGKWDLSTVESIRIHTANPIGADKMTKLWKGFCESQSLACDIERAWPYGKNF
jgi:hypothetical protein